MFMSSSSSQVAAIRGERAHIQFRGFSPAERDQLVQAMGNKITVQESPWDCLNFVSMHHEKKPFDDKRVRRALSLALDRYEASQKLSKITIVKDVRHQVPAPQRHRPSSAGRHADINANRAGARLGEAGAPASRSANRGRDPTIGIWLGTSGGRSASTKIETIQASRITHARAGRPTRHGLPGLPERSGPGALITTSDATMASTR
jgi:peptide/nickel transport system substrate-binding protein